MKDKYDGQSQGDSEPPVCKGEKELHEILKQIKRAPPLAKGEIIPVYN